MCTIHVPKMAVTISDSKSNLGSARKVLFSRLSQIFLSNYVIYTRKWTSHVQEQDTVPSLTLFSPYSCSQEIVTALASLKKIGRVSCDKYNNIYIYII